MNVTPPSLNLVACHGAINNWVGGIFHFTGSHFLCPFIDLPVACLGQTCIWDTSCDEQIVGWIGFRIDGFGLDMAPTLFFFFYFLKRIHYFWGDRVFSWVSSEILWSLIPVTEIIETSKKWHQTIQIRIIRLSLRSLTICSLPRIAWKTSKWLQVKARNRESVRMCLD